MLERYLRVLDAPKEVQDAFRAGRVSLVKASRVACLPQKALEKLATDLRAGADPKRAIAAHRAGPAIDPRDAALGTFVRSLERNVEAMQGRAGGVRSLSAYDTQILGRAHDLIGQILKQVKGQKPRRNRDKPPRKRRK
jgi:hypothetical protein